MKELSFEIRDALDEYSTGLENAEDCLDAIISLCENNNAKAIVIEALAREYGYWSHIRERALKILNKNNIDERKADLLALRLK